MAGSKLTGLDEVLKRMEKMRVGTKNKHIRKAMRKAMIPIRDQAKENTKKIDDQTTKEKIWRNIRIEQGKIKQNGELTTRVGVAGGAKAGGSKKRGPGGDTWYWRLVELGTSRFPATPFLRTAFEQKKDEAQAIFVAEMRKAILEELN